jgi:hypothetical protein
MSDSPFDFNQLVFDGIPMLSGEEKATQILKNLEPGEPYFVFRAQDILSTMVLNYYAKLLEEYSPGQDQIVSVVKCANDFRAWQHENPNKVKLPD